MGARAFLIEVARRHPAMAVTAADIDVARARVRAARLWENPTFSYDREVVFDAGEGSAENIFRVGLPLELSGSRALRVESAEEGVQASRAEATAARVALLSDAMRIYLSASAWRERVRVLDESRKALAKLHASVRARSSAGDASTYDVARIEAELDALDDALMAARGASQQARLQLGAMVGRPGAAIGVVEAPENVPVSAIGTAAEHPRISAATHRMAQHESAVRAASRGWVPEVVLSGGAKSAPTSAGGGTAWGYVAGVSLSVPVFDHGQADEQRARAELGRARAERELIEQRVSTERALAHQERVRAREHLQQFERAGLGRAETLRRIAEVSYREGERNAFELIDAHRAVREARLRLIALRLQAKLSDLDWLQAYGREPGGAP